LQLCRHLHYFSASTGDEVLNPKDLQLEELQKALRRLKEALAHPKNDITRDSVIQRFEFTVELSWKVLQKRLKSSGIAEALTPKNVFREAARLGIVADPEAWIHFIDERNLSSHTYKEKLAEQVYASAQKLPPFVDQLLIEIEKPI
jgi:nucleotidyltransferase substrate binding protein (TIGR01987 family)